MPFTGKVAFVTGAGSGIGKATAVLLQQHGCNGLFGDESRIGRHDKNACRGAGTP